MEDMRSNKQASHENLNKQQQENFSGSALLHDKYQCYLRRAFYQILQLIHTVT
jgi:hypothetical protein